MWIFSQCQPGAPSCPPRGVCPGSRGGDTWPFVPAVLERRYPKEVQELYETMRRFARILGPLEHDKFIESHARESGGLQQPCSPHCPVLGQEVLLLLLILLLPLLTTSGKQMHLWFDMWNEQPVGFFH